MLGLSCMRLKYYIFKEYGTKKKTYIHARSYFDVLCINVQCIAKYFQLFPFYVVDNSQKSSCEWCRLSKRFSIAINCKLWLSPSYESSPMRWSSVRRKIIICLKYNNTSIVHWTCTYNIYVYTNTSMVYIPINNATDTKDIGTFDDLVASTTAAPLSSRH